MTLWRHQQELSCDEQPEAILFILILRTRMRQNIHGDSPCRLCDHGDTRLDLVHMEKHEVQQRSVGLGGEVTGELESGELPQD